MNKNMIIALIAVIVVGAGAFFGGMKYDQAQRPSQQPGQGNGGFARRFGNGQNGQAVRGQVISNDNGTLTVKMRDGSTK
ncbi:MAG TPA: hypothetical protein VLF68_01230, partial [Candidatus Saccharimonadales bacterium]|nr:hypothetical protein [Candidatus Saccharimonadales bacterium]